MDREKRKYATIVINGFFGKDTTTPETVTERAVMVVFEALEQLKECSSSMDLIPRPKYGAVGLSYPLMEIVKIGKRIQFGDESIYLRCRDVINLKYKTRISEALMGI